MSSDAEVIKVQPLVSVVVPVFNVVRYVDWCLASVLTQDYQQLQIVVVDDGSTDGSSRVVDRWASVDPRVEVIHQENRGLGQARNVGLDAAKGEWVAFVDSDDWLAPDFVAGLLQAGRDQQADIVVAGHWDVGRGKSRARPVTTASGVALGPGQAVGRLFAGGVGHVWAPGKLYRRRVFDDPGLRYSVSRFAEDGYTTYKIIYAARRVCYVPDLLYFYRRRAGSLTRVPVDQPMIDCIAVMLAEIESWLDVNEPGLRDEFDHYRAMTWLSLVYQLADAGDRHGVWGQVTDWLAANRTVLVANSHIGWKSKLVIRSLLFDGRFVLPALRAARLVLRKS